MPRSTEASTSACLTTASTTLLSAQARAGRVAEASVGGAVVVLPSHPLTFPVEPPPAAVAVAAEEACWWTPS